MTLISMISADNSKNLTHHIHLRHLRSILE